MSIEAWLPYHTSAKGRRQASHQSQQAIRAKAAQPLGLGASALRRGEAGRMLTDLKRDLDG